MNEKINIFNILVETYSLNKNANFTLIQFKDNHCVSALSIDVEILLSTYEDILFTIDHDTLCMTAESFGKFISKISYRLKVIKRVENSESYKNFDETIQYIV